MKKNFFTAIGLMSGTSMDGVDLSVIKSDGYDEYTSILDEYYEYSDELFMSITSLRDKIHKKSDLDKYKHNLTYLEREITLFHSEIINKVLKKNDLEIDLVGFHGQTIYHNAEESVSKQIGNGLLLSQLIKKEVVYNFRNNDLKNGGQGAPLTPIFHKMLVKKFSLEKALFINIGGIINSSIVLNNGQLIASDHGPGMCLIDEWIRKRTKKRFDNNGEISKSGKIDKIILNQAIDNLYSKFEIDNVNESIAKSIKSFDVKDFSLSFVKGLSLENGAATLIELTAFIVKKLIESNLKLNISENIYLCGGGRKNKFLVECIKKDYDKIKLIDEIGVDGDYVESQAFGYLAIRSILKLPISFPETTGCKYPLTGGETVKNF